MKRNVGNGRGGGGDSNSFDLVVKKRRKRKRKRKRKDEGEMATPPRSDRCWSRSPSSGDEDQWRGPKTAVKWVVGLRWVGLGFSQELSGIFNTLPTLFQTSILPYLELLPIWYSSWMILEGVLKPANKQPNINK